MPSSSGKFVLALDQGTTSSRAVLVDHDGQICGIAQQEFAQIFPRPGWVEHDPELIWRSQLSVAQSVLKNNHVSASDLVAIGISNQRETTVLWDRTTGTPIAPAIVWQDRRTADLCEQLRNEGKEALFQQKTGLILDAYFSGTKLKWLLDHTPGARGKAEKGELAFGTVDSWLIFKLCGAHVTDVSNASRTLLFNIHTLQWDHELLALLEIPVSLLPKITTSSGIVGKTDTELLGTAVPIAGIAGDQQAATFGQACIRPGMVKNTYGTGCFMLLNTGAQIICSKNKLLTTVGWALNHDHTQVDYMLEGSIFMAGAIVQWLRDGLQIIASSADIEPLAASVADNGGVVLVPAFTGLGAPYWDPQARAAILGMTRGTNKAHIARAALESIAYQTADVLHAMQKDAHLSVSELRVDGGAAKNDMLMQFQADILDVPVLRPAITETSARGAAYLAGLAVGFWDTQEEIASQWKLEKRFEPTMTDTVRRQHLQTWQSAVRCAQSWRAAECSDEKKINQ